METAVYINKVAMDLVPETVVAITLQANDIAELQDRQASFSNRIKLPTTNKNNKVFEGANQFMNATSVPYELLDCRIVVQGFEIVPNGVCEVTNVTPSYYEVVVYSGTIGFFESLGDKTLRDLNLSTLDHTKDFTTIINSLTNTSGYIYAVADYFNDSPNDIVGVSGNLDVRYLLPAVFVQTIWNAIFNDSGFSYTGADLIVDVRFRRSVLPFNGLDEDIAERIADVTATDTSAIVNQPSGFDAYSWPDYDVITDNLYGQLANRAINVVTGSFNFTGNVDCYRVNVEGSYSIRASITYDSAAFVPGAALFIAKIDNTGVGVTIDNVALTQGQTGATLTLSAGATLLPGETICVFVLTVNDNGNNLISVQGGTTLSIDASDFTFGYGSFIPVGQLLPNMKQKDFIKNIANMLGLSFQAVQYSKVIDVYFFNEVSQKIAQARDWSDKYQMDSENVNFKFSRYAQQSYMRFADDDTLISPSVYDGFLSSNNVNLPTAADVIKLSFSGTDLVVRFGRRVASIPIYAQKDDGGNIVYVASEEVTLRICIIDMDTAPLIFEDGTTNQTINNPPVLRFAESLTANLDGQTLLDTYYTTVSNILQNTKAVTCKMALRSSDVDNFDFSRPVFVAYFGAYFYVNKISNYVPNRLTTVELIRI